MKILISRAEIAGPTLAYWLVHHGFESTIVETAPRLRTGGYVIDFWGAGFEITDPHGPFWSGGPAHEAALKQLVGIVRSIRRNAHLF